MKIHPNDFSLEEFLLSLSKEHLGVVEHLIGCSTCRRRFMGLLRHRPGVQTRRGANVLAWREQPTDYGRMLDGEDQQFQARERALAQERLESPGLFVELMRCPVEQRGILLNNAPRFHTWGVFELLVERSLETSIKDPALAEELGKLALGLAEKLDSQRYGPKIVEDLRARTWAYIGNAQRVRSDLDAAEQAFDQAYKALENGTQDLTERAILMDLESSLRRDQRRFNEALKLLQRAISIFIQSGQQHRAGRSLLKISTVYHYAGRPAEGIPLLYRALDLIDPEEEPRLLICARHNLIDDLAEAGRFIEAQSLYRTARPLYRSFPDAWTQNRRKWVKGKIARGLGQADQAESLFLAARDGFIEEGIPYDTALVSLELATLYAEQGRTRDLRRLAEGMVPIFSSLHIHREALAALAYLKQAAEAERATVEVVSEIAEYLRRAQHDPALRFRAPGA
ncbi:MAG: hypothetical protein ACJ75H_10560 [Thermoanaerobaculia bacterium]